MIDAPVRVEPVKVILPISGMAHERVAGHAPVALHDVEDARPARRPRTASSASRSTENGVISEGLSTTALPAASAGADLPRRHAPAGSSTARSRRPRRRARPITMPRWSWRVAATSPPSLSAYSAKKRRPSAVNGTSQAMASRTGPRRAHGFERAELRRVGLDQLGPAAQHPRASRGARRAQSLRLQGGQRIAHRAVHVAASASGSSAWALPIGGTTHLQRSPSASTSTPADEVPVRTREILSGSKSSMFKSGSRLCMAIDAREIGAAFVCVSRRRRRSELQNEARLQAKLASCVQSAISVWCGAPMSSKMNAPFPSHKEPVRCPITP